MRPHILCLKKISDSLNRLSLIFMIRGRGKQDLLVFFVFIYIYTYNSKKRPTGNSEKDFCDSSINKKIGSF